MKTRIQCVLLLLLTIAMAACNPATPEKAVAYNDGIVDIQARVVGYFDTFVLDADTGDSVTAAKALEIALDSARTGFKRLEAMPGFDGSTRLRDAAKELVRHYIKGLDEDFRGIVGVLTNHNATLEQLEHANQVRDAFEMEEDRLFKVVQEAQLEMAQKHHFEFEEEH